VKAIDINSKLPKIKKELIALQKKMKCATVLIKRYGIEFIYFTRMANGRKNVFTAGITCRGIFETKEF